MNVYDFDKTICKGDSETDFFYYELIHHPINLLRIPYYFYKFLMHKFNKISREEYRNSTYLILKNVKDVDLEVLKFWKKRKRKILPWYLKQKKDDDIIVSATPRFLIEPILIYLGIKKYIVSEFDVKNRKCIGLLNYGEEKLKRFKRLYDVNDIDNFYSDSLSDISLMLVAKKAYQVIKYKPVIYKKN